MSTLTVNAIENLAGETPYQPTLMTPQTAAGSVSYDFTGIPSWVKKITIMLDQLNGSGTSDYAVQLGDAGGIETTGYISVSAFINTSSAADANATNTTKFTMYSAGAPLNAVCELRRMNAAGTQWAFSYNGAVDATADLVSVGGGSKTLSAILTQVRITTVNGTDTLDSGDIAVMYE